MATLIAGAKLITLPKKDGGIRPIAIGELTRRLAGKILVARYQASAAEALSPWQWGVACPAGAESIIHRIQQWAANPPEGTIMAQVDLKNAYGCVSRPSMLAEIRKVCPQLLPYSCACYGASAAIVEASNTCLMSRGVHQGGPLSPLFYSLAIHPVLDALPS